jgi:hypothetical protein
VSPDPDCVGYPKSTPYVQQALAQFPRLLSSGDREPLSLSYGCFDRSFWAWKFTDFAGARFQEAAYALAHCYCTPSFRELSGHRKILEWARASMAFWRTLQRADGSFDEAYPFEHSLAATAFTGFYVGEAYQLLSGELSANERSACRTTFARAGDWLVRNDEFHGVLSNHLAAAAAALIVVERVTEDHRYGKRAQHFVQRIYEHQSSEGWYEEYGGADPGYQSHGTFYLARIWQLTRDRVLLESLSRSVAFLKYFIHPNGTLGGEYGSRNTEFFFPAGFEILASALPEAAAIAAFMRPAIAQSSVAGLPMMDRYNLLPMLNNYLFADAANRAAEAPEEPAQPLPCEQDGEWYFPDAGLLVRSTASYCAVIGLSKGGVIKIYNRRRRSLVASDCGYWVKLPNGRKASNQSLARPPLASVSGNSVEIKANFVQINQRVMSPWLFAAFRVFSLTVGRSQSAAYWVKNILAYILVRRRSPVHLTLQRIIVFGPNQVSISDILSNPTSLRVSAIWPGDKFATIHMGSARYFQYEELSAPALDPIPDAASQLTTTGVLQRSKTWTVA